VQDNGDSPCLVCSETIPGEPGTLGKDNDLVGSMETPELQTLNQITLSPQLMISYYMSAQHQRRRFSTYM
jgi:hypothetical protein